MPLPVVPSTPSLFQGQIGKLLSVAALLAVLYFGREVLVPITLALILSLLVAPLVRVLKRFGLGQAPAALGAVGALTVIMLGLAVVIGLQVVSMASSLPQYEATLRAKVRVIESLTIGRMEEMRGEAGRMMGRLTEAGDEPADGLTPRAGNASRTPGVVAVEVHERPLTAPELVSRVAASVWGRSARRGSCWSCWSSCCWSTSRFATASSASSATPICRARRVRSTMPASACRASSSRSSA